jgi:hypothetical protein
LVSEEKMQRVSEAASAASVEEAEDVGSLAVVHSPFIHREKRCESIALHCFYCSRELGPGPVTNDMYLLSVRVRDCNCDELVITKLCRRWDRVADGWHGIIFPRGLQLDNNG